MKKILSVLRKIIFYAYILPMIFYVPFYNWQYANENGFGKWLMFGEVASTAKALIWPYYFFFNKQNENYFDHFKKSIGYSNEGTKLNYQGQIFSSQNENEIKKYIDLKRKALEEGKLVDIGKLNGDHPNFGNHFHDEYLKGLQLLIDGYQKQQNQYIIQAQVLLDNWSDWYSANLSNIKARNRIEVQVKQNDQSPNSEAPKFNASELERYSKVLKKINEGLLSKIDIDELRSVMIDYTSRTGSKITKTEYNSLFGVLKTSYDYMFELGSSLLYSWDQKKIFKTNNFNELYQTMSTLKLRSEEKLTADLNTLKAAANNQSIVTDESGRKYKFGREIIQQHMKQNEVCNTNIQKVLFVIKDFIE